MKKYIPPAGHRILWKEIFLAVYYYLVNKQTTLFSFYKKKNGQELILNSATSSLFFLLYKLKSQTVKNEVIIPGYSCPSVAAAVIKSGLKPVLCDLNLSDFSLDEEDLKQKINKNTLAIIQVELFGLLPNNERIVSVIQDNNVYFIGDTAQSYGNYLLDENLLQRQKYDYMI